MKHLLTLAGIGLAFLTLAQVSSSQDSEIEDLLKQATSGGADFSTNDARLEGDNLVVSGRVEIFKRNTLTIAAERPGILKMVEPNQVGAMVEAKQVVAQLKDDEPRTALQVAKKRAENEIEILYAESVSEVNQAALEKALAAVKRSRGAFTSLEIKEKRLEVRRSDLQIQKAREDKIIAGLERDQAAAVLTAYELASEISGEVTEVMKRSGEAVSQGDPIMTITDLSTMKCFAEVPQRFSGRIRKGASLTVKIVIENEDLDIERVTFPGRIIFIKQDVGELSQAKGFLAEIQNKKSPDGEYILRENLKVVISIPGS